MDEFFDHQKGFSHDAAHVGLKCATWGALRLSVDDISLPSGSTLFIFGLWSTTQHFQLERCLGGIIDGERIVGVEEVRYPRRVYGQKGV